MGLDWRALDLGEYLEAMEAHNEAHSGEKPERPETTEEDRERLAKVMALQGGGKPKAVPRIDCPRSSAGADFGN